LKLVLEIFCIKEGAEAKGKASPSSPRRGDQPEARRKAILEVLLQLLGTAQGGLHQASKSPRRIFERHVTYLWYPRMSLGGFYNFYGISLES